MKVCEEKKKKRNFHMDKGGGRGGWAAPAKRGGVARLGNYDETRKMEDKGRDGEGSWRTP